jgi:nitroimidazol reductase NimA-like FMN-containing flavoprotein (pyridoxamine 5'-phosphate oxidase superfamily)
MPDRTITELDEAESLKLISPGGIGRIAYQSRFGPAVLPVNYKWHEGAVVFRTARLGYVLIKTRCALFGTLLLVA